MKASPNVLLEAIACGTPSIAFDCPTGPAEVLAYGGGVLVPAADVDALARGIRSLAGNPWQRDSLAQTASRALAQFAPERINALWLDLMHSVGRRADTLRGEDA
ncbi:MAG: glycosyltransferase [Burkholderiaceae bacterium]|nr:glycosyltransferase [Burkholderiaceae bacterium]